MSFAFERRSDPAAVALRARILDALPAGGYQMDRFFQLLDLELSREIDSAAVRCGERPKLLLNPDFVARFCQSDEHLFLLVMHELMHVVLGHTRLFQRPTLAHNIAFDAVINAMLCRQFPGAEYVGFFGAVNGWEEFPGRLLRPAPGWPASPAPWPVDASEAERTLHARLYGDDSKDVTYHEIFELLVSTLRGKGTDEADSAHPRPPSAGNAKRRAPVRDSSSTRRSEAWRAAPPVRIPADATVTPQSEPTLLGSHESSGDGDDAANDPTLIDVLRRVVGDWPAPFREIGRDRGMPATDIALSSRERAVRELELAIERLFARAGLKGARTERNYRREVHTSPIEFGTVVPQLGDRRARVRSALSGTPAVYYEGQRDARRLVRRPVCRAFVYLDISGSMDDVLPRLLASLRRPVREGAARLFVFSTIVDEVNPRSLDTSRAKTTGGTDVDCVLQHVLEQPPGKCPKRIVLLTDGFVGRPERRLVKALASRNIEVITGLTPPGSRPDIAALGGHIEVLPALGGNVSPSRRAKKSAKQPPKRPGL